MINLSVEHNIRDVLRQMERVYRDQIPFATSLALNTTAFQVRDAQREAMEDRFIIRRKWVKAGIQVPRGGRATKRKLEAIVEVEPKRKFLYKFEKGGRKVARDRDQPIAIPTEHLRPNKRKVPPLSMYPKNLRLQPRRDISGGVMAAKKHRTRRGVVQWKGHRRTFVIDPAEHRADPNLWGVWERFGPRRHQIRMIWAYRKEIPIPPLLQFEKTAESTVQQRFSENFRRAFERAMETARQR